MKYATHRALTREKAQHAKRTKSFPASQEKLGASRIWHLAQTCEKEMRRYTKGMAKSSSQCNFSTAIWPSPVFNQ